MNYHNRNTDNRTIRKWAVEFVAVHAPKSKIDLDQPSDFELKSIGVIGRALAKGYPITPEHKQKMLEELHVLELKYQKKPKVKVATKVAAKPVVEDKNAILISKHKAEIDAEIDAWAQGKLDFSAKAYLESNNVPGPVAKAIGSLYVPLMKELQAAVDGDDEQLVEGYRNFGKVRLKRFVKFVQSIISDCAQQVVTVKVRKPRVRKEKPASVQVAKLKYMKSFTELKLTSENPERIIGAEQVYLYDTEKRKLFVYGAETGQKLGVRGTTITGFSVEHSSVKLLRKPEVFMAGSLARRAIATAYKALTTKAHPVNGRVNDKMIILKVF